MKPLIIAIILISSQLIADNIHLKNGTILVNVRILEETKEWIRVETSESISRISTNNIKRIDRTPYIEGKASRLLNASPGMTAHAEYPNLRLLPISFIAGALAWSEIAEIGEYRKADIKVPIRKYILSGLFMLAGIVNTAIAIDRVELEAETNRLTLRIKIP